MWILRGVRDAYGGAQSPIHSKAIDHGILYSMHKGTIIMRRTDMSTMSDRRTLFQVSLLQALCQGDYEGHISISELRRHGDTGLGTFEGLDGEMIMLDGIVYRASAYGTISVVKDDSTPFACVSFMDESHTFEVSASSFREFSEKMEEALGGMGLNSPYFVKIHSRFPSILLRSVPRQSGRTPLSQVIAEQQIKWYLEDIEGTVVGLFCPSFMSSLNNHGWHLHFITDNKKIGGHVLDFSMAVSTCQICRMDSLSILLPGTSDFQSMDLDSDRAEEIRSIESVR